jgi:hypothetical protein
MKNKTEVTLIALLLLIVVLLLWVKTIPNNVAEDKFIAYIDSIEKRNKTLFNKIDSLSTLKHEQFSYYEKINLKYDTIQIAIDTMPNIEGTKYLLTISRQLTSKGVE